MSDGETGIIHERNEVGNYGKRAKLLDAVPSSKATANVYVGPWVDVSTLKSASVEVKGTFTGTVNIEGVNHDNPQSGDTGFALVTAPTAAALVSLTMPIRYVRARVSGFTAGTVSAFLLGVA